MPIVSATQVTVFSNISASAATIESSGLIPIVQERANYLTHNYFVTDLCLKDTMTFNATARTIVANNSFVAENFLASDEIHVYYSYRNDGYYIINGVSDKTLTLATGSTVVDELSGRTIVISVVNWPTAIAYTAAQMVYYDYDIRKKRSGGVTRTSLGPWSEAYGKVGEDYGYPPEIIAGLDDYCVLKMS